MSACEWPGGCEREKRAGKGMRYCAAHERVQQVRESRRKRRAAQRSREEGVRYAAHAGPQGGVCFGDEDRALFREYREVLRAFGLIRW